MQNVSTKNLVLDGALGLCLGVLVLSSVHDLAIHMAVGLAMVSGVVIHQVMHWKWIKAIARSFRQPLPAATRVNVMLDLLSAMLLPLTLISGLVAWPEARAQANASLAVPSSDHATSVERQGFGLNRGAPGNTAHLSPLSRRPDHSGSLWGGLHHVSAILLLLTLAGHLVLHARWIMHQTKRLFSPPVRAIADLGRLK